MRDEYELPNLRANPYAKKYAERTNQENEKPTEKNEMRNIKIIVEKHPDGYVAYPLGITGVVVGQGDTYEEALADVKSAIQFHLETFGESFLEVESPILEAFVAEAGIAV